MADEKKITAEQQLEDEKLSETKIESISGGQGYWYGKKIEVEFNQNLVNDARRGISGLG